MVDMDMVMTLLVPTKVLCNMWSYDFYDMTDTPYNDKICYTDNFSCTETLSQEVTANQTLCRNIFNTSSNRGNSNKYPKHMFYEEIRKNVAFVAYHSTHLEFLTTASSF